MTAASFMWLSETSIAFGMLVLAGGQPHQLQCSPALSDHGRWHQLSGASVFDGPPEDLADLIPDHGRWDLVPYQSTGRQIFVVCRYFGTSASQTWAIPFQASECREATQGHAVTFVCH